MSARTTILKTLGQQLGAIDADLRGSALVDARLGARAANTVPARSDLDPAGQCDLFVEMAQKVETGVTRVSGWAGLPGAVADAMTLYEDQSGALKCAPHPDLEAVAWAEQAHLAVTFGGADPADLVGLSRAYAGMAETGTLVLLSSPQSPTALNFLPDTHFIAVTTSEICGSYEAMWARLRAEHGPDQFMPRCVNWVTGPSRTADIEQTMLKGVHGPRRVHIFLIDDTPR